MDQRITYTTDTRNNYLVTILLQKISREMYLILKRQYSTLIHNVMTHLKFKHPNELLRIYGRLKYLNNEKGNNGHNAKELWWTVRMRSLINSINTLSDLDSHPIGLEIAIEFQQYATQNILNVKRLNNSSLEKERLREEAKLRETPHLDRTNLYENDQIVWVRVVVDAGHLDEIVHLLKNQHSVEGYQKMYKFTDTVIEFYFTNLKCRPVLEFFNNNSHVKRIIFYSNCKSFKKYCTNPLAIISNILKFYYCNLTSNIDFDILSIKNSRSVLYHYIMSILFYMKNNLKVGLGNGSTTPLSILSGNNPRHNINNKSNIFEPMDAYDELCLKNNVDLSTTPMSTISLSNGNLRHKLYEVCSDRDARLMSGGSIIGGRNQHELIAFTNNNLTSDELDDIVPNSDVDLFDLDFVYELKRNTQRIQKCIETTEISDASRMPAHEK